jgi:hypothetical protein
VRNPRASLEKVCGFLDLPYTDAMLDYHRRAGERLDELSARPARDGGVEVTVEQLREIHARTRLPVNDERVGRWRQDLTAAEIAAFQQIAGPFLRELGYDVV